MFASRIASDCTVQSDRKLQEYCDSIKSRSIMTITAQTCKQVCSCTSIKLRRALNYLKLTPDDDGMQLLYDTFSAFGMVIATPKIMRDPDSGASRGFGFVSFDGFEASDTAIEAMNGQYLCNR